MKKHDADQLLSNERATWQHYRPGDSEPRPVKNSTVRIAYDQGKVTRAWVGPMTKRAIFRLRSGGWYERELS